MTFHTAKAIIAPMMIARTIAPAIIPIVTKLAVFVTRDDDVVLQSIPSNPF
jgi:hypothetical protein